MTEEFIIKGFDEIIAIRFHNGMIHFGQKAIDLLKETRNYKQLLSRAEFRFMSRFDFGHKWGEYADSAPTLFKLGKDTPFNIRVPK